MLFYIVLILLIIFIAIYGIKFYRKIEDEWLPQMWETRAAKVIRRKFSKAVSNLFWKLVRDWWTKVDSICEYEGDEHFVPFMDSPLRTCPPCEFVAGSPKEELIKDANANETVPGPNAGRGRGRGRARRAQQNNPVVRVRRIHPAQNNEVQDLVEQFAHGDLPIDELPEAAYVEAFQVLRADLVRFNNMQRDLEQELNELRGLRE